MFDTYITQHTHSATRITYTHTHTRIITNNKLLNIRIWESVPPARESLRLLLLMTLLIVIGGVIVCI